MKNIARALGAFLVAGLAASSVAHAQATGDFPNKPIRVIVPFPPGGSADAVVRMLSPRLNEKLGQQIVVENRAGAGGNIGLSVVAKSPADGYTVGLGAAGSLSVSSSLFAQIPFDVQKDFKPITMLATIPFVLIGNPSLAARTQKELIALEKAQPGKLTIAHGGNGTAMHLSAALFSQLAGVKIVDVSYKGSGPAALDVLAGNVPLAIVDLPSSLQHIRAGKVIAYAVTSTQRLPQLPEVPTVAEAGLAGYESVGWFGLLAPAGTPTAIVNRLSAEITAAMGDEKIRESMRNLGIEPAPSRPEAFDAYIRTETAKWAKVIREANIKVDQ